MTSLAEEREEQQRWQLRPRYAALRRFDKMMAREFLPPEEQAAYQCRALSALVDFAADTVPYYRDLFARLGLESGDIRAPADLPRLPTLAPKTVRSEAARLRAPVLPAGERLAGSNASSGSTGPPTRVWRTYRSRALGMLLTQRQLRWYRFDPAGGMARIQAATDLLDPFSGAPLPEGQTLRLPAWPGLGHIFRTGPFFGFARTNSMAQKLAWLEELGPDYLTARSGQLEHLALALQGRPSPADLRGLRAVAEPLTEGMARRIEEVFHAPVHISFGMDEIEWIATRCREGGRYHVHSEVVLAEVVDEDGAPTAPGAFGRMLVTVVGNLAMPLIRYETGDLVQALGDDPCPCGRTLPAFGVIRGRYRHIKALPEGALDLVAGLRAAVEAMPPRLSANLREYRFHLQRDLTVELRLITAGALLPAFAAHMEAAWQAQAPAHGQAWAAGRLRIVEVAQIARPSNGKFFHFTSDFSPPVEIGTRGQAAAMADDGGNDEAGTSPSIPGSTAPHR